MCMTTFIIYSQYEVPGQTIREGMKTFGDFQKNGKSPLSPPGLSQNPIKNKKKSHFGKSLKKPGVLPLPLVYLANRLIIQTYNKSCELTKPGVET